MQSCEAARPTYVGEVDAAREPITIAEHLQRKLASSRARGGSRGLRLNEAATSEGSPIQCRVVQTTRIKG